MKKITTLNSGGMDSLIAIARMHYRGYEQHSIFIDVGQPNSERAKESAKRIAEKYCTSHEVITLSSNFRATFSSRNRIKDDLKITDRVHATSYIFPIICAIVNVCDDAEFLSLGGYKPVHPSDTVFTYHDRLSKILNSEFSGTFVKIIQPLEDIRSFPKLLELAESLGITKKELEESVSCNCVNPCEECIKCELRKNNGMKLN